MRGKDPLTGEFLASSRSDQRRAALEVFELGELLVALSPAQLAKLPIPDALDAGGAAARQETATLHRIEAWRERLLAEGDAALAQLLDQHPDADSQGLRQLVRNTLEERKRNKPPRAYRELFRTLRELMSGADEAGEAAPDNDDNKDPGNT